MTPGNSLRSRPDTRLTSIITCLIGLAVLTLPMFGQETLLLRQPSLGDNVVAFAHGADIWVVDRAGGLARRLTSTQAVESHPHLSPDGARVAFASNRSGTTAVYVVPVGGGTPTRLTWYPGQLDTHGVDSGRKPGGLRFYSRNGPLGIHPTLDRFARWRPL